MEKKMGLESLKRNTKFLRKNNIDFYILHFSVNEQLNRDGNLSGWKAVKEVLPYNSFFLEVGPYIAAVILPEKTAAEAERLLKAAIEAAGRGSSQAFSLEGKVYRDINEELELEGVLFESSARPEVVEEQTEPEEETKQTASENKLKLSVLDDDEVIRLFLSDQLEAVDWGKWDVDLQVYREGETFLSSGRLEEDGKHIIVLDGIMPRMDGMEVLSEIRKRHSENEVSIIMLTSRNRENDIVSAFEAGAFDYVTKPFKINELIARIKRVAKRMEEKND
ncbi:response regulator transcription factor [Bacillus sp. SCS-153A]|uniref:response regulator transcription factor n=1 Tax=Rossellomorea sedimentorum TaxID=3115294 RepID=UPI0039069B74